VISLEASFLKKLPAVVANDTCCRRFGGGGNAQQLPGGKSFLSKIEPNSSKGPKQSQFWENSFFLKGFLSSAFFSSKLRRPHLHQLTSLPHSLSPPIVLFRVQIGAKCRKSVVFA
jgi:hypothetical protein